MKNVILMECNIHTCICGASWKCNGKCIWNTYGAICCTIFTYNKEV